MVVKKASNWTFLESGEGLAIRTRRKGFRHVSSFLDYKVVRTENVFNIVDSHREKRLSYPLTLPPGVTMNKDSRLFVYQWSIIEPCKCTIHVACAPRVELSGLGTITQAKHHSLRTRDPRCSGAHCQHNTPHHRYERLTATSQLDKGIPRRTEP